MLALILTLVQKLVVPEIIEIVRRKAAANNGVIPTAAEVEAEFVKVISEGIAKGTTWLDSHPG